jgi:hypothetical protein
MNRFLELNEELVKHQRKGNYRSNLKKKQKITVSQSADDEFDRYFRQASVNAINWCNIKADIIRIARAEEAHWRNAAGNKILESDPAMLPDLEKYWRIVIPAAQVHNSAVQSAADNDAFPWSAAFISWVMSSAGVTKAMGFELSQRHMSYVVQALRNREASDRTKPFWLYDNIEVMHEAVPAPGDILCKNAVNDAGVITTHWTYSGLRRSFFENGNNAIAIGTVTGSSHCDIVVDTIQRGGRRFMRTVGGNVSDSVSFTEHEVDQNGTLVNPRAGLIFGIIKLVECP